MSRRDARLLWFLLGHGQQNPVGLGERHPPSPVCFVVLKALLAQEGFIRATTPPSAQQGAGRQSLRTTKLPSSAWAAAVADSARKSVFPDHSMARFARTNASRPFRKPASGEAA